MRKWRTFLLAIGFALVLVGTESRAQEDRRSEHERCDDQCNELLRRCCASYASRGQPCNRRCADVGHNCSMDCDRRFGREGGDILDP